MLPRDSVLRMAGQLRNRRSCAEQIA
eukprot:SAG25_NODE_7983_length_447_cov_1.017241_1_plen_25_part_01